MPSTNYRTLIDIPLSSAARFPGRIVQKYRARTGSRPSLRGVRAPGARLRPGSARQRRRGGGARRLLQQQPARVERHRLRADGDRRGERAPGRRHPGAGGAVHLRPRRGHGADRGERRGFSADRRRPGRRLGPRLQADRLHRGLRPRGGAGRGRRARSRCRSSPPSRTAGCWSGARRRSPRSRACFEEIAARRGPEDVVSIIYTSGTTGNPKGVVLSHRNFLQNVAANTPRIGLDAERGDTTLVLLPPWHVFERAFEYCALSQGATFVFSSIKSFSADLERERPDVLISVPRLWESIYEKLGRHLAAQPRARRAAVLPPREPGAALRDLARSPARRVPLVPPRAARSRGRPRWLFHLGARRPAAARAPGGAGGLQADPDEGRGPAAQRDLRRRGAAPRTSTRSSTPSASRC